MPSRYLESAKEANQCYNKITLIDPQDAKAQSYQGRLYAYYGRTKVERSNSSKAKKIFKLIVRMLLIPMTFGLICLMKPYLQFILRKFKTINESTVHIYVLEKLKEPILKNDPVLPEKVPEKKPQPEVQPNIVEQLPVQNPIPEENEKKEEALPDIPPILPESKNPVVNEPQQEKPNEVAQQQDEKIKPNEEFVPIAEDVENDIQREDLEEANKALKQPDAQAIAREAEEHLQMGRLDQARETATQQRGHLTDDFYNRLTEAYIAQEKLEWAVVTVKDIKDQELGKKLYAILADKYAEKGLLEVAMQIIVHLPPEEQKGKYCNVAKAYFQKYDYEKTYEILSTKVKDLEIINPMYKEFALLCCEKGEYRECNEFLQYISPYDELLKNQIFIEEAKKQLKNENYDKVVSAASWLPKAGSESFCYHAAKAYLQKNRVDDAARIAMDFIHTDKKRKKILRDCALKYHLQGDREKAYLYNIYSDVPRIAKAIYINFAKYSKGRNENKAFEVLKEIVNHGSLINEEDKDAILKNIEKKDFMAALNGIEQSPGLTQFS